MTPPVLLSRPLLAGPTRPLLAGPARLLLAAPALLFVLSMGGCDQINALMGKPPPAPPKPVVTTPVAPPKPKVVVTPYSSGKFADALPDLEKALAATPTDDAAWDNVEIAAVRGGQGAALLDRLAADTAIGGRVDRHQALRAELALGASRAPDALAAARLLETVSPGDAAALTVRAIRAGAPKPDGLTPVEEALLKVAAEKPSAKVAGTALSADIEALPGARAALLRAEIKAARGDVAGALAEVAAAKATGLLGEQVAIAQIQWEPDAAKGWAATTTAAEAASKALDFVGAARILDAGRVHALRQWKAGALLEAATAGVKSAGEQTNTEAIAWYSAVQAAADLHLGLPGDAKTAATLAAATPSSASVGKWRLALAESMLGDQRAVAAAAAGLPEADAKPITDLASAMSGGTAPLPTATLTGDDAAWQAILGAGWVADRTGTAARAAAVATSPDLKLWGQLWASHDPLTGGPDTPQMASENAVRAFVKDGTPGAVLDNGHPYAAHWRAALSHGTAAPSDGDIGAFTRLVASVDGAFADQAGNEMNDLSAVLPDWRSGPLAPVSEMDGPRAAEIERIVVAPSRLTEEDALPLRATWHAWRQRDEDRTRLWTHGVSPVPPALGTPERLAALWGGVAKQRAGVLAWLGNSGPYPTGTAADIDNVAVELKLLPRKAGTLADLRDLLGHSAALSFVPASDGGIDALYLTDHGGEHKHLDAKIAKDVADYSAGLENGKAPVSLGNKIRAEIIDPAVDVLTGYGNYFVLGPPPLGALPVDALPEQEEGLRFLAAIRHTFYYPTFAAMEQPTFTDNDFVTTMLAVVGDAAAGDAVKRIFPDAVILSGKEATRDAWLKEAPRARFLHFEGVANTASGGFVMPGGGTLELADMASTPLVARTVAVIGPSSNDLSLARLSAFRAAGAGDFFATGVGANTAFNGKISEKFWDATNKRLPVWKAVGERAQVGVDMLGEKGGTSPGLWGALLSAGRLQ